MFIACYYDPDFQILWQCYSQSRSGQSSRTKNNKTNNFGVESIPTLGAKIWALVSEYLGQSTSLNSFKKGIGKWSYITLLRKMCSENMQCNRALNKTKINKLTKKI